MKYAALHLLVLLQVNCLTLFSQALDVTFSGNGKAKFAIGNSSFGSAVAIQPADQKIVMAGESVENTSSFKADFCAVRFLPNGTFDSSFGAGGIAVVPVSFAFNTSGATAMALQPDGKIVMVGTFYTGVDTRSTGVVRLTKDGIPDAGFGSGGIINMPMPTIGNAVAVQPDGNILVAGQYGGSGASYSVVRLLGTDGSLDPSFGSGGQVTTAVDGVYGGRVTAMAIEPGGQILVTGNGQEDTHAITVRYNKSGTLDNTFGAHGISTVTVNGGSDRLDVNAIAVQSDGYILLAGDYYLNGGALHSRMLVIRLRPDGTLDIGFAGNGKLGVPFPNFDSYATSVGEEYDGRIIVSGATLGNGKPEAFALARVTVNGDIDYPWGTGGEVTTTWSGTESNIRGMAIQSNGKIVCTGLVGNDIGIARYNDPVTLLPPPVVTATNSPAIASGTSTMNLAGVHIFPNPAPSELQVQGLDPAVPTLLAVKDASGRTMMTVKTIGQNTWPLDIHRLPSGTYFLELSTTGVHKSFPFLKTP